MASENSAPVDGLSGLVERVTFHNEDTGFAVLKVKVKGRRDLVPVVGVVAAVSPGEWITAEGRWERSRDHGMQLRATDVRCHAPTSLEGIEKYLGSGLIRGIGPVYAKKMVAKFGEKIFEIIENSSARLEDVEMVALTQVSSPGPQMPSSVSAMVPVSVSAVVSPEPVSF